MDKKIVIVGLLLLAMGAIVWILNLQLGIGWHYGGAIFIVDGVLSVSLPLFGLLFVYLGMHPNPLDIAKQ